MFFAAHITFTELPMWYIYGLTFILGAMVGSFLNVCILRIPEEGMSIIYPPDSHCPRCKAPIRWYDNIPILSYLFLRGRCRSCHLPISIQYPLIELLTAVMAVAVLKRFGLQWSTLVIFLLVAALIVITFIDLAHWIIPDEISLPGIPIGVAAAYFFGPPVFPTWQNAVWGAVIGGGALLSITLFYEYILKRPGMGLGDVKLLAMLGAFLGWKPLFLVVLLASIQGLIAGAFLYLLGWKPELPYDDWEDEESLESATEGEEESSESATEEEEEVSFRQVAIPFGPFLSLGALEVLFWKAQIMSWLFGF